MTSVKSLFMGIFVLSGLAWAGLILVPFYQFGQMEPFVDEDTMMSYPLQPTGLALRGQQVYMDQGCVYCHTQQVRPAYAGGDLLRGWGTRRTVARDYIYESPALLGYMRLGPDLANAGSDMRIISKLKLQEDSRFEGKDWEMNTVADVQKRAQEIREAFSDEEWQQVRKKYEKWLHEHLYNPRIVNEWSIMPAYESLYQKVQLVGAPSPEALEAGRAHEGFQVVPTGEAEALVAYLMSLNRTYSLPEATP